MHIQKPKLYRMNRQVQDPAFYISSSIFKAPTYVFIISFLAGYGRLLFIGFHPVLNGIILGLICGTVTGKLLKIEQRKSEKAYLFYIWAAIIFISSIIGQYWGLKYSLPTRTFDYLIQGWSTNDFREYILWNPIKKPQLYLESINRHIWLFAQFLDLLALLLTGSVSLRIARNKSVKKNKLPTEWPIYRMLFFYSVFIFSLYYTSKPLASQNYQALETWGQELWADSIMSDFFTHENSIIQNPNSKTSLRIIDQVEKAAGSEKNFPEAHLWIALNQIQKGHQFLIKDELDRAVGETEHLKRRILLPNGSKIDANQFLAHLYQIRAKYRFLNKQYLLAERDLTVAIMLHREYWANEVQLPRNGYYKIQNQILADAGYSEDIGFGSSHYERYLVRTQLGDNQQALLDLNEAKSLKYEPALND